jgi:hypothetical protein
VPPPSRRRGPLHHRTTRHPRPRTPARDRGRRTAHRPPAAVPPRRRLRTTSSPRPARAPATGRPGRSRRTPAAGPMSPVTPRAVPKTADDAAAHDRRTARRTVTRADRTTWTPDAPRPPRALTRRASRAGESRPTDGPQALKTRPRLRGDSRTPASAPTSPAPRRVDGSRTAAARDGVPKTSPLTHPAAWRTAVVRVGIPKAWPRTHPSVGTHLAAGPKARPKASDRARTPRVPARTPAGARTPARRRPTVRVASRTARARMPVTSLADSGTDPGTDLGTAVDRTT